MVRIDLHGLSLAKAKETIRNKISTIINDTKRTDLLVTLIHGHNNGTAIRDYIRGGEMEKELKQNGTVRELNSWGEKEPGKTTFRIVPPGISDLISAFNRNNNFGQT